MGIFNKLQINYKWLKQPFLDVEINKLNGNYFNTVGTIHVPSGNQTWYWKFPISEKVGSENHLEMVDFKASHP
jgi:hypothetical protein